MNRSSARTLLSALTLGALFTSPVFAQEGKKGRKVAVLVAVQDYSDTGLTNLKYTENDIGELAAVLKAQGYKDDDVVVLTDTAAAEKKKLKFVPTAGNVRATLRGVAEDLRAEDTLVVAFSGHGAHLKQLKEEGLHFCAKGTDLGKPETMVSLTEVYALLDKECKAELKVLFVDACRNDPTDGKSGNGRLQSLTRPLLPDPPGGTVAFFSCSTGQKSYESDSLKHGIFFHHVIQGLKGGPADDPIARKGEVTVPLLEDYLTRAVPVAVKKDKDDLTARQVPERKGALRGQGVLARSGDDAVREDYDKFLWELKNRGSTYRHFEAAAPKRLAAWVRAADTGDTKAQVLVGVCHFWGTGVAQDHKKAVGWYEKAAARQEPAAVRELAFCYAYGLGVPKDTTKAFELVSRAAAAGHASAVLDLANMHGGGIGVAKDERKARELLARAIATGSVSAKEAEAENLLFGAWGAEADPKKGFRLLTQAADAGSNSAKAMLCFCRLAGLGVEADDKAAFAAAWELRDDRLPVADFVLGACLTQGRGTTKDAAKGVEFFRRAAGFGMAAAKYNVGSCLWFGTGVRQDRDKGFALMREAADEGDSTAMAEIGWLLVTGDNVRKDEAEGVRWLKKAADLGHTDAKEALRRLGK